MKCAESMLIAVLVLGGLLGTNYFQVPFGEYSLDVLG